MERWQGRVAVVTGASAGIGAAIAEDLVESGMVVVGLARREDRLIELKTKLQGKAGTFHHIKTDVTKEDDVKTAFKWITDHLKGIDVLVNNAGIFVMGKACDGHVDEWKRMFEVNVFALGSCIREAIKSMKERNVDDGHIVNINSVASHRIGNFPGVTAYSASKHASLAITEGIRRELAGEKSKIKVTSISPGVVETEIFVVNNPNGLAGIDIAEVPYLKPKDIADAVHYVIATPSNVQIIQFECAHSYIVCMNSQKSENEEGRGQRSKWVFQYMGKEISTIHNSFYISHDV